MFDSFDANEGIDPTPLAYLEEIKKRGNPDPEFKELRTQYQKNTQELVLEKKERENQKVKLALATLCSTDAGVFFLRWLCQELGFKSNVVSQKIDMAINTTAIVYNEARRNVWWELRNRMNPGDINKCEMEKE